MPRQACYPLDEYGERYAADEDEYDDDHVDVPKGLRARFRIHLPLACEGSPVSSRRIRQILTERRIHYALRVSRATGNQYLYVRARAEAARRALRDAGVFWA